MIKPLEELDQSEGRNSEAYKDYVDALARILKNDPEDLELDRWREDDGRPLATFVNVAAIAGRKAQRLMGRDTPFPVLAAYIKSLRAEYGVVSNTTARLKRQAEDIGILVQRLRSVRSKLAASIIVRDDLAKELALAKEDVERARGKRR